MLCRSLTCSHAHDEHGDEEEDAPKEEAAIEIQVNEEKEASQKVEEVCASYEEDTTDGGSGVTSSGGVPAGSPYDFLFMTGYNTIRGSVRMGKRIKQNIVHKSIRGGGAFTRSMNYALSKERQKKRFKKAANREFCVLRRNMRNGAMQATIELKPADFLIITEALMIVLEDGKTETACGPLRIAMLKEGVAEKGETCVIKTTVSLMPNEKTSATMKNEISEEEGTVDHATLL